VKILQKVFLGWGLLLTHTVDQAVQRVNCMPQVRPQHQLDHPAQHSPPPSPNFDGVNKCEIWPKSLTSLVHFETK